MSVAWSLRASVSSLKELWSFSGPSVRSSISEVDDDSGLSLWSLSAEYHGKRLHQHTRNHFSMISYSCCQVMLPYFIADQIGLDSRLDTRQIRSWQRWIMDHGIAQSPRLAQSSSSRGLPCPAIYSRRHCTRSSRRIGNLKLWGLELVEQASTSFCFEISIDGPRQTFGYLCTHVRICVSFHVRPSAIGRANTTIGAHEGV